MRKPNQSLWNSRHQRVWAAAWLIAFLLVLPVSAAAITPVYSTLLGGAIRGYDPVAYFTESRPVEGKKAFSHMWKGATWYFSSERNRDLFRADPEKYAPNTAAIAHTP